MQQHGRKFSILGLILLGLLTFSGCATKKYVRNQVAALEPRVTANTTAITEVNERLDAVDRKHTQNIAAVDQKATAAAQQAAAAAQAAGVADSRAASAERKADAVNQSTQARMDSIDTRVTSLNTLDNYSSGGPPQVITFKTNSDVLTEEGMRTLDGVVSSITGQQTGYMIEIHGFTDTTGGQKYNVGLSQRRADSARRYLVEKGVPLHRTAMLGLGEQIPAADNNSSAGRQQNRRVEIRVLRAVTTGDGNN